MAGLSVLCVAAVIVAIRVGLREADRDEADLAGRAPRVRVVRGERAGLGSARVAYLLHAGFVALGVTSLLFMLLALAAVLVR